MRAAHRLPYGLGAGFCGLHCDADDTTGRHFLPKSNHHSPTRPDDVVRTSLVAVDSQEQHSPDPEHAGRGASQKKNSVALGPRLGVEKQFLRPSE